ncbi:MAG TPA: Tol-Pal system beta propeller repeat protein TolB [Alphaproteobacteria bacterium]|nr:Tol-Pal system beta propeller repeat protein TolB [Alphaproteobacteria bacterium]
MKAPPICLSRNRIATFATIAVLFLLGIRPAAAELHIDITRGNIQPMPVAIMPFTGESPREGQIGGDVGRVVSADLERSGLFKPLDPRSFIQTAASLKAGPRFGDWRVIGAQALVSGEAQIQNDGKLKVEFRLWDVFAEQYLIGRAYSARPEDWRRVSHIIADAIYKRITGEDGYFDTRIVYVAETGPRNRRIKRLAIMDQDGENNRFLTSGQSLVLTPRFSPSTQEITYLSYTGGKPRVYIFNIDTGRQEVLGDFPGMTFAPRFSPDGNRVVLSSEQDGNSEIYLMDLRTHQSKRLTFDPSIDTAPSMSPDGQHIAFESDRGGSQQIYTMNADGTNVQRISHGQGIYATPVWSPRGDIIAFTKQLGGTFYIGVMRTDGSGEREIAQGFLVEGPTWAPNGRVLMFFRQTPADNQGRGATSKLYTIDITGYNERQLVTPTDASDPAWSPLIP